MMHFEELKENIPVIKDDFQSKIKTSFKVKMPGKVNLNFMRMKSGKKFLKILLLIIAVIFIVFAGRMVFSKISYKGSVPQNTEVEVKGASAEQLLNREFLFPLKNDKGEEVNKIKYIIEKAELRDEIIVQGQKATAVSGRTFLVITLKITNEYKQSIKINTRDYIRLVVNNNENELLAPDIHNDPVEIQAISTKYTRVGFPVNDTDQNLTLLVGEINGEKERVNLELK